MKQVQKRHLDEKNKRLTGVNLAGMSLRQTDGLDGGNKSFSNAPEVSECGFNINFVKTGYVENGI